MKIVTLLAAASIALAAVSTPASALTLGQVAKITADAIKDGYKVNPHDKSLVKKTDGTVTVDPPDIVVQLPDVVTKLPDTKLPDTKVVVPHTGGVAADWADAYGPCGPWHEFVPSGTKKYRCVFVGVQSKEAPGPTETIIAGAVIPGATVTTPGGTQTTITPPVTSPVCNTSSISFSHPGGNPLTGYTQNTSTSQSAGSC